MTKRDYVLYIDAPDIKSDDLDEYIEIALEIGVKQLGKGGIDILWDFTPIGRTHGIKRTLK